MSENTNLDVPLDINKVISELTVKLISNSALNAYGKTKTFFSKLSNKVRLNLI